MAKLMRFINILLAALLAGKSFGIWIGFNPMLLSGVFLMNGIYFIKFETENGYFTKKIILHK